MKLEPINWRFFKLEKDCQFRAAAGFSELMVEIADRNKALSVKGMTLIDYKNYVVKRIYALAFYKLSLEKKMSFEDFKLFSLAILNKERKTKQSDVLEEKRFERTFTEKEAILMKIEADLEKIFDSLEPSDFINKKKDFTCKSINLQRILEAASFYFSKLKKNYNLKNKYYYDLEFEMMVERMGRNEIIKTVHFEIGEEEAIYDLELLMTVRYTRSKYNVNSYILYSTENYKRLKFNASILRGDELDREFYNRMFNLEQNAVFKNFGKRCLTCEQRVLCMVTAAHKLSQRDFVEERKEYKTTKNKYKLIKNKIENRAEFLEIDLGRNGEEK